MCGENSDSTDIRIRWERRAVKEAASLQMSDRGRVFAAVDDLRKNPLKGKIMSSEWKGFRRLRVGAFRVIYAFDGMELLVSVVRVGHRREVYR